MEEDAVCVWRGGRLWERQDEHVRGLDPFFLDSRRGDVDLVSGTSTDPEKHIGNDDKEQDPPNADTDSTACPSNPPEPIKPSTQLWDEIRGLPRDVASATPSGINVNRTWRGSVEVTSVSLDILHLNERVVSGHTNDMPREGSHSYYV